MKSSSFSVNVANFEYHEPVVKQLNTSDVQTILVTAEADLDKMEVHVKWFNSFKKLWYCHATVLYEECSNWLSTWSRSAKLVTSRIEALNDMAAAGEASKLTTDLAYSLFGKLVNYSKMYQTMKSVILNEDEATAEVILPEETSGAWIVPPHFIDGVVSLSGFILNGGTHFDNTNNFYITPSWKSMRFAKPLTPGGRYLVYVRMVPADNHTFVGDVYILQGAEIVGVTEAIVFRQWPRIMLNRFFSPSDAPVRATVRTPPESKSPSCPMPTFTSPSPPHGSDDVTCSPVINPHFNQIVQNDGTTSSDSSTDSSSNLTKNVQVLDIKSRALDLVADELAVDVSLLTDETNIADLGIDSLMSLVMSQRLREDLGIEVRDAFFLEITSIGDLKRLLH